MCFGCGKIGHRAKSCQSQEGTLIVKKKHWKIRGRLLLSDPSKSNSWFETIKKVINDEEPISGEHKVRIAGQYLRGYVRRWYDQFLEVRIRNPVKDQPETVRKAFTDLEGMKEVSQQAFRIEHKEPPQEPTRAGEGRVNPALVH